MKLLVTGGLGFIGSNFVRHALATHADWEIVNLDALTYAANPANVADVPADRHRWVRGDIADPVVVAQAMAGADVVVHFAAESHVDRSIDGPQAFLRTNVLGTQVLLEAARDLGVKKFLHVSTDEVYGSVPHGQSCETAPLLPNSPYSASKASSDLLARAYHVTYGLPVIVTRCSNNFGPYQYPEKALPLLITNALEDQPFPMYGGGANVRDWLFVRDHVRALDLLIAQGVAGEIYNIGGTCEIANAALFQQVLAAMDKPASLIQRVADRPGHDLRYALDCCKLRALGWRPESTFAEALQQTIAWYRDHAPWWKPIKDGQDFQAYYRRQYGARMRAGAVA